MILRNLAYIGILANIGSIVRLLGMLVITIGTVMIGYLLLNAMYEEGEISSPFVIYFVVFCIGYVVSALFMAVFAMAVDTTLQCFVADKELSRDRSGENNHTPPELKSFVGKNKGNRNF